MGWNLYQGDSIEQLKKLPDQSVQTVVTSPPYWSLRDYGVEGQLGLEPTPELYVQNMVAVFREVKRVLRDDGTVWLNLGDSYAGNCSRASNGGRAGFGNPRETIINRMPEGLKNKDLVGIPWLVAFALRADGWYLRQDIIWAKPNPMPESVTDRCTKSHEYIFLLSKSRKYYYDAEAIKEPANPDTQRSKAVNASEAIGNMSYGDRRVNYEENRHVVTTRNKRSVWTVSTQPYKGVHFATFPPKLIEPCILAGSSHKACEVCGAPWERVRGTTNNVTDIDIWDISPANTGNPALPSAIGMKNKINKHLSGDEKESAVMALRDTLEKYKAGKISNYRVRVRGEKPIHGDSAELSGRCREIETRGFYITVTPEQITTGWQPTCKCENNGTARSKVLDPFAGSGTTLMVAEENGRDSIGIELNPEYCELIKQRMNELQPRLFYGGVR